MVVVFVVHAPNIVSVIDTVHQHCSRQIVPVASSGSGVAVTWLPTLDNLRNFLLTTTTEVLSFFQQLREAP
jgi:hypothetical protein